MKHPPISYVYFISKDTHFEKDRHMLKSRTLLLTTTLSMGSLCMLLGGCDGSLCEVFSGCDSDETSEVASADTTASETVMTKAVKTVSMKVEGMNCMGCVNSITSKVDKIAGVVSCEVSLEEGRATIALSDADSESDVEETIKKLGFKVEALPDYPEKPAA
jgi:copper chaperone